MVRILIFLMFISFNVMSQNVTVTSEMNYTELFSGAPLKGSITVTHNKNDKIDESSFKLGNDPLKVNFLNNVTISEQSPLIVSLYSFEIPTLPKGLHFLPQISVKVGGKVYKSYSISFEVFGRDSPPKNRSPDQNTQEKVPLETAPKLESNETPLLKLEAKVMGPVVLYPGQETKFVYKFYYRGHIDLSKEELPLLEGVGLKKVGDKLTSDYVENGINVSEFGQVFIADKPGTFEFGPSYIEGLSYEVNASQEKIYASTPLHSETTPIKIEVKPFPQEGKPASFNGSIGSYAFSAKLGGGVNVTSQEKLTLLLEMQGDPKFLQTVQAPDLCCQPGFSGNFKPSDLPPISTVSGNTKRFLVDLKPLSPGLKEIPPIEFSSYDPTTNKYLTVKSAPIPIQVNLKNISNDLKADSSFENTIKPDDAFNQTSPIEIAGNDLLKTDDLKNIYFGNFWNLLWIPVFLVLLYTIYNYKREVVKNEPKQNSPISFDLFKKAIEFNPNSPEFSNYLKKAFMHALKENKEIENADIDPDLLKDQDLQGEVKRFLLKLDEIRFTGKTQFSQAILSSAKELFSKLQRNEKK